MLQRIKRFVRPLPPPPPPKPEHGDWFFSQQGEDMIVNCLLQGQATGFYVDVGAHHPFRFSNTAYFHAKGWKGINIDPSPEAIAAFQVSRPGDTNLNLGVADKESEMTYYIFSEPAVNTFSAADAERCNRDGKFKLIAQRPVRTLPLHRILAENLPSGQQIDLMSVDVEGLDEMVLRSNDWTKFRPRLLLAEDLKCFTFAEVLSSSVAKFLESVSYVPIAKATHTVVFADKAKALGRHDILIA